MFVRTSLQSEVEDISGVSQSKIVKEKIQVFKLIKKLYL
jgi:hypothetical protein